ncbi:putative two-component system response regulator [Andreprevotia lacus DSM 23236]|uniref:Putative two-component system response regulator n=1 Tax=Andreprevotia lacus DSM 23236 TaxID=1121001 RepID=A0A1W1X790_9NEIS|nr:HD domain-containing phosphohydrolase [Andreprevotia lacus]SMC19673.1 putative two-component system response regulator [Andreprevotia lacus DSM 23236]
MKVVIIDDTQTNLLLIQHLFKRLPEAEPLLFQESRQGLEWCLDNEPDLIVVDYMMPEPDGLAVARRIRAEPRLRDVPLIMVTANQQSDVRYEALGCGVTDFITKPIDNHEFVARMRNMMTLRANQLALAQRADWLEIEVSKATAAIRAREREMIVRLSRAAEARDPETGAHLLRMANYAALIARAMGWSAPEAELLLHAAPMHDIGKVGIPDAILLKPGRLDADELTIMQTHPAIGHELLARSDSPLLQLAATVALTHHEKYDGSGYPQHLQGDAIPEAGRIVAVADVFDALLSPRPYKQAWTLPATLDFLREQRGAHFDPRCVDALLDHLDEALQIRERYQDNDDLFHSLEPAISMRSVLCG